MAKTEKLQRPQPLAQYHEAFTTTLDPPASQSQFHEAVSRHRILADYSSITDAIVSMRQGGGHADSLTLAFLAEHRRTGAPVWFAALYRAYYPMLRHIRWRIAWNQVPSDELDQIVVVGFLEVLANYDLDAGRDRAAVRLKTKTQRRVFAALNEGGPPRALRPQLSDLSELETVCAEDLMGPKSNAIPPEPLTAAEQHALVAILRLHTPDAVANDDLESVIGTMVKGVPLRARVRAEHPTLTGPAFQQTYQRIKRRHSRTLTRLRKSPGLRRLFRETCVPIEKLWPFALCVGLSKRRSPPLEREWSLYDECRGTPDRMKEAG